MEAPPPGRLLYSPNEVARLLDVSRSYVYSILASGDLASVKVGSATRVRHEDLVAYLDGLAVR